MINNELQAGTKVDSDMQPIVIPSADIAVNPLLAARAFVNIYEDTEGRFIGDAEWETWEEAYSERDELSTYVETVEIVRRRVKFETMAIKEEMQKDYQIIPMNNVSDEARLLAVAWHENATDWIGDKHKLASNIMNYARRSNKELIEVLEEVIRISDRKHDAWDKAKAVLAKVGR